MADVIILGAGATGLSVAYHLEKNGFSDYHIFERDQTSGGLCRTVTSDGFKFDYTGHLLHINNEYVRQFFNELVGREHFHSINRRAFVYSQDTYTRYPYQMNLHGLPVSTIAECLSGFITRKKYRSPAFFHDWVMHYFGAGFGKHFFLPYQRKIFAYPVKKLSSDWTGGFVPRTSLHDILEGAINDRGDTPVGYNAQFLYPKSGGIEHWIKALQTRIKNQIYTDHEVIKIDLTNKTVLFKNGHSESYKTLISTLPLDVFLQKIHEPARSSLKKNHDKLHCTSIINFNLGITHNNISDKHWVYVPEKKYPFYRLGFCHNFSPDLVPSGCSSLYGEIAHRGLSTAKQHELYQRSVNLVSTILDIAPSDIITQKRLDISHGYVIYDTWRTKNIPALLKSLEEQSIYSCGRYGAWKYSSMQDAILDGKNVAQSILFNGLRKTHMNTIRQHLTSFYKHKKVLVTGGAGFIGSHITHELVSLGAAVTVLDNLSTGTTTNISSILPQISFIEGSITNQLDCTTALKDIDIVFHLAAKTSVPESLEQPADYYHTNVTGTLNLLEAARMQKKIKGFIFSSSSAVYGPTSESCSEEKECHPTAAYGYTKYVGELLCQNYKKNYGIPAISLRYFNVYGPRQNDQGLYAAVVPRFIYQLKHNLPLTIYGDGSQSRDFVPVSDVVQANLLLGMNTSTVSEPCFNIASNTQMTLLELIKKLRHNYPESRSELLFEPARQGDILHSQANIKRYQLFLKKHCLYENL